MADARDRRARAPRPAAAARLLGHAPARLRRRSPSWPSWRSTCPSSRWSSSPSTTLNSMSDWGGLSLDWYRAAWANEAVQEAAVRSLVIATVAALVSTAVATLAALGTVAAGPLPRPHGDLRPHQPAARWCPRS